MREYFIWLAKVLTVAIVFVLSIAIVLGILASSVEKNISQEEILAGERGVCVVELKGPIYSSKEVVSELYRNARRKKCIGTVLSIESPGGVVGPSQEIYIAVKKLKEKKPIVAYMGAVAASGGLYSALSASKIVAQPGTLTGSIGVIFQVPNFSKLISKIGVDLVTIKSGKLKDIGNTFRKMTPEEKNYLQSLADTVHREFMQAVSESRNIPLQKVRSFADGRIILGEEAKALGLIDKIGDIYDAASLVYKLAGKPLKKGEQPKLLYKKEYPLKVLKSFLSKTLIFEQNIVHTTVVPMYYMTY